MAKAQRRPPASSCILHDIEDAKAAPAFFSCSSGELLWGQIHTVIAGSASAGLDTYLGPHEEGDDGPPAGRGGSGTVLGSSFHYRVAARKGQWKVEAAYLDDAEGKPWHLGFVCHHVDVDGVEVLRRAAEAGLAGNGRFAHLDIVFVDRYDWSGTLNAGCELIVSAVEGKDGDVEGEGSEDERYYRALVHGRFMLVDTQGFPSLIKGLKDGERIERRNYLMRSETRTWSSSSDSKPSRDEMSSSSSFGDFGTHLVVEDSEYDMGWMAFQHGKLVGFVYDGAYSALEGDRLRIGDNLVTSD